MTTQPTTILIIDDDAAHREMMREVLHGQADQIVTAATGEEGLEVIDSHPPDLILLDMRMPGLGGLGTLEALQRNESSIPTIVMTAFAGVDDAVRAMKLGAVDYLQKPVDLAALGEIIHKHLHGESPPEVDETLPPLPPGAIFASALMKDVLQDVLRVARSQVPVLLVGETGVGKEIVAKLLHAWGSRPQAPLVFANLAALPDTLLERELFGHVKGSFTGADRDQPGLVEAAAGGTLFLDEIGELAMPSQPKLLRLIESGALTRIGDTVERKVDFRLISATNRNLEEEVEEGRFRQDLYYRLAVITLEIPPLRERPEDIIALARHFLRNHLESPKSLTPATEELLLQHRWPGNIRELRNVLVRAGVLAPGQQILPEHLPSALNPGTPASKDDAADAETPHSLADVERQAIEEALERCDGNRTRAAEVLGISRRKLLYRLSQYRRDAPEEPRSG